MAVAGTINSDLVSAGQGTQSIYPGTIHATYGSLTIGSGTSFTTTDQLVLCAAPGPNSSIVGWFLDFPLLATSPTFNLTDGTNVIATVTSTVATGGGVVNETTGNHGKFGNAVAYTTPTTIYLSVQTGASTTVGASAVTLYFGIQFVNF